LGDESIWAGAAAECAAEQDKFWEYHDYLFENWDGENRGTFSKEKLKGFAAEMELDTEAFNECVDSGRTEELVRMESKLASEIGVRSTPTFAVNGKPIQGALAYPEFQSVINAVLRAQ
jgi:protein-disulfide isomerase